MTEPDGLDGATRNGTTPGQEIFPTTLPLPVAMGLGLLLILLFAVAVVVAVVVPVPDTIRCPFVIVPEGGADPVRAPREGTILQVLVAETGDVKKGQALFVIQSQEIRNWTAELRSLEQEVDGLAQRAALLEVDQRSALEIQAAKVQQFDKDLGFQQEYLDTLRDFLARYEKLDTEGLVPRVDVMSQRLAASKAERDLAMTRQSRDMAALDTARIKNEHRRQMGQLELEQRKAAVRIAALRKFLADTRDDLVRVTAPFDGTVVTVQKKNVGDVVSFGQELCTIARSDSALIGQLVAPENGVARLRVGQRVQFFYQAFPYERFGTGRGTVRWVSPAAVTIADGNRFVVHAELDGLTLGKPGTAGALRAGMQGEARIIVGKRTLIEYVFEPLRKLRETSGTGP